MRLLPLFIRRQIIRRTKHFRLSSSRRITRLSYKHCYNVELLYVICGWVWPGYVKRNLKGGGLWLRVKGTSYLGRSVWHGPRYFEKFQASNF